MEPEKIKAIAVDVDGTFMDSENNYNHAYFRKILDLVKSKGVHFMVASGRPLPRLRDDFKDFLNEIDLIADNGAILVRNNNVITSHYFTRPTLIKLINYLQEDFPQMEIAVSGLDQSYYLSSASATFKTKMTYYYLNKTELNSFEEIPADVRATKLTLWSEKASDPTKLENEFNNTTEERIHVTTSGFNFTDVLPYGVNKSAAIKYFLRVFNLDRHQLMAFGDSMNDAEMLNLAELSYAMGNADEEVKKIAKYQAPSNDENGVLKTLEEYFS